MWNTLHAQFSGTRGERSMWMSDTSVVCLSARLAGLRASRRVSMTLGGAAGGSITDLFSYSGVILASAAARVDVGVQTPLPLSLNLHLPNCRSEPNNCSSSTRGAEEEQNTSISAGSVVSGAACDTFKGGQLRFCSTGYQAQVTNTVEGSHEVVALLQTRCLAVRGSGPACDSFSEWVVQDTTSPEPSRWYLCADVDSTVYCPELLQIEDENQMSRGTLSSRALLQDSIIYKDYLSEQVEGTTLVYTASASYSTQQQDWHGRDLQSVNNLAFIHSDQNELK